ncbi:phenylalanine 4-monooxygenase [Pseudoalteromonas sp. MMG010]|uniref:phenylalanine 4-monooxygenase n=1 Tax=Pseudoalteromonas sp. MMG010 TaxID=2822685 RepID=UPI001B3A1CF0|nr:phenylalanine 4-monooxygenase [Pseudoalteromonas sp. MMG010]MBQ4833019.1 phenylalanine 4-monooxygenase [Pseudoalteromonas sp. MMG010]
MAKMNKYKSKAPDENGIIHWTNEEHKIWSELITRQLQCIKGKACDEYLEGLDKLNLPHDRIPQLSELNSVLKATTGWQVTPVPALIDFDEFFRLLANKQFPVATFIRSRDEFDYLQEPDIFHEIFGHCAMLTNTDFAEFTHKYGQLGYAAEKKDRAYLARIYWFTIEFGLMQSDKGLKIYGGGVLSSPGETQYVYSTTPDIKPMNVLDVLRTPYRIDIMQPVYFTISSIHDLFEISKMNIMALVAQAKSLGLYEPQFPAKEKLAS